MAEAIGKTDFYTQLGELIAAWNGAEWALADLLEDLSTDRLLAHLLCAQLGGVPTGETIKAVAAVRTSSHLSQHIGRAIDVFDRLRVRRNQFVHAITAAIETPDGALAFTYGVRAKGAKLRRDVGTVDAREITYTLAQISGLNLYLTWLRAHVRWEHNPDDDPPQAFRVRPDEDALMPLPEPLPDRWEEWAISEDRTP